MAETSFWNDLHDKILWPDHPTTEGHWTAPRTPAGKIAPTDGTMVLSYFTAWRADEIDRVTLFVATVQGASVSLAKVALFSEDTENGALTRVAVTASDTALLATAGKRQKAFTAAYTLVPGQRYALGVLCVGDAGGQLVSTGALADDDAGTMLNEAPRVAAQVISLTDVAASYASNLVVAQTAAASTTPGRFIAFLDKA